MHFSNSKDYRATTSTHSDLTVQLVTYRPSYRILGQMHSTTTGKRLVSHDVSKSLVRVWYEGFLAKVHTFGFSSALSYCGSTFLNNLTVSLRIDGLLSQSLPSPYDIPQGSALALTPFFLIRHDLLPITFNPTHCFGNYTIFHCSPYHRTLLHATTTIGDDRTAFHSSLNTSYWGSHNHVGNNASTTSFFNFKSHH